MNPMYKCGCTYEIRNLPKILINIVVISACKATLT